MPATEFKTYGDVLAKAAHILDRRGLAKGRYEDVDGHVCFMGAVSKALGFKAAEQGATARVLDFDVISDVLEFPYTNWAGDYAESIPDWNDEPGRTKKDVVKKLKLAAWVLDDLPLKDGSK